MRLTPIVLFPLLLLQAGCAVQTVPADVASPTAARQVIQPPEFPATPYSAGVLAGDTLYISGQLGQNPAGGALPEGIAAQTRQAMDNIGAVLKSAGMGFPNLVKCHVYLATMDDYMGMNQVYGSFFVERVPARTTVEAGGLPQGAGVQIACIGYRDLSRISVVRPAAGALPAPLGPYSAAVWAGDTLYLSGMGGQFPEGRRLPEPLGAQVTQTLVNIRTTLDAAGLHLSDVVSSNVYVTRPDEVNELNAAYAAPFGSIAEPPTGLIFLPRLPGSIKAEITFIAAQRASGERTVIAPADPAAGGARALRSGGVLYARAEAAPDAGQSFDEQFRAVLRRLEGTCRDAGFQLNDAAHVHVYLAALSDLDRMHKILQETFPTAPPAVTAIQVMNGNPARVQVGLVATR